MSTPPRRSPSTGRAAPVALGVAVAVVLTLGSLALLPGSPGAKPVALWVDNGTAIHYWNWSVGGTSETWLGTPSQFNVTETSHFAVLGSKVNSTLALSARGATFNGPGGDMVAIWVNVTGSMSPAIRPPSVDMYANSSSDSAGTPGGQWEDNYAGNVNTSGQNWYNTQFGHVAWYGGNGTGWYQQGLVNQSRTWQGHTPTVYQFTMISWIRIAPAYGSGSPWLNTSSTLSVVAVLTGLSEPVVCTIVIPMVHGYNPDLAPP
jgi:hypothetical protein